MPISDAMPVGQRFPCEYEKFLILMFRFKKGERICHIQMGL